MLEYFCFPRKYLRSKSAKFYYTKKLLNKFKNELNKNTGAPSSKRCTDYIILHNFRTLYCSQRAPRRRNVFVLKNY